MRRLLALALLAALPASAEEGMWTYDAFPTAQVKKAHGFEPSAAWLEHLRLASVRLAEGCSASFVSPQGLVMTNHHCIRSCLEDLSTPESDWLATPFSAATLQEERRCPRVEAHQLVEMTDVTARLQGATRGLAGAPFHAALKAEMTKVEGECSTGPAVRCEVVTLFHGGRYHLYKYRRFQDVRLVFAPEFAAAAFGGDPDNFNFPRYGFDVAFLRVWEDDQPLRAQAWLPWAREPVKEGALVFVSGHPGSTERLATVAELEFQRDVALPHTLLNLSEMRGLLRAFAASSPERLRMARSRLRAVENGLKALRGQHQALADPAVLASKRKAEAELQARVRAHPKLRATTAAAWDTLARALDTCRPLLPEYRLKEGGEAFPSQLFASARALVRAAEELPKPDAERLREYTDARLPALKQRLLRPVPVQKELEALLLGYGLHKLREQLGADDPFVRQVLGQDTPEARARALVEGSRLDDVEVRRALLEGGKAAVDASEDPLIVLARGVDADARAVRKRYEDSVESVLRKQGELLAQARLALLGTSGYPDATFTLRLSYGTVQGWQEAGRSVPPFTTFGGAFARHTGQEPFKLPDSWLAAKDAVPPSTPLDLCTTHDIIGGNSGSPMVDTRGHVVGLVFDGNLASLGGRYAYVPAVNRAVAVHAQGILAGLEQVYRAERVAQELRATQIP